MLDVCSGIRPGQKIRVMSEDQLKGLFGRFPGWMTTEQKVHIGEEITVTGISVNSLIRKIPGYGDVVCATFRAEETGSWIWCSEATELLLSVIDLDESAFDCEAIDEFLEGLST